MFSAIACIDIKDFRCLQSLHLDFNESPIVCIQAGNDSGKSSAVKAIETIMYNDNERKNKGYIRTGCNQFIISVTLKDGTSVERVKGESTNIYRILAADGSLVKEWQKLDGTIPDQVKQIFGLVQDETTGELLNIRTCESLLLFALTKASENHKIFYGQLKVDDVSNAMVCGKNVVNTLSTEIRASENTRENYMTKLRSINVPDMTSVDQLKSRIDDSGKKMFAAKEIIEAVIARDSIRNIMSSAQAELSKLSAIPDQAIEQLKGLSDAVSSLTACRQLRDQFSRVKDVKDVSQIDYDQIKLIEELEQAIVSLRQVQAIRSSDIGVIGAQIKDLTSIDATVVQQLNEILDAIEKKKRLEAQLAAETEQLESLKNQLDEAIKQGGLYFDSNDDSIVMRCEKCGEENRLKLSLIEKACEEIK